MGSQFQYKSGNHNQGNSSQGWKNHPSIGQQQNNTSGQGGGLRQQQPIPLWQQVNSLTKNVRELSNRFDKFFQAYESDRESKQAKFKELGAQIGQLAKRIESTEQKQLAAHINVSPKEECKAILTNEKGSRCGSN